MIIWMEILLTNAVFMLHFVLRSILYSMIAAKFYWQKLLKNEFTISESYVNINQFYSPLYIHNSPVQKCGLFFNKIFLSERESTYNYVNYVIQRRRQVQISNNKFHCIF